MKNVLHVHRLPVYFRGILALLFTISLQAGYAQTDAQLPGKTATPENLRVYVHAPNFSPVLRIRYEVDQLTHRGVRIQIRDKQGNLLNEQVEYHPKYVGKFDLSGLPTGTYTVDVQTPTTHHRDTIRVRLLSDRYPVVTVIRSGQPADLVAEQWAK